MKIEETWNRQSTRGVEIEHSAIRQKKSVHLVHKILNRLKLERTTTYFAGPILLIFTIYHEEYLFSGIVGLYVGGLIGYYNYLIGRIESVRIEASVFTYLTHALRTLKRFRTHYLLLGVVSFLLGFGLTSEVYQFELQRFYQPMWIVITVAVVIATPLVTFYIHFYPHLKKIRRIVVALEGDAV